MRSSRESGLARVIGLVLQLSVLPGVGRSDEARALAQPTIEAARALGSPFWIAFALVGYGRAYADSDPALAMDTHARRRGVLPTSASRVTSR